MALVSVIMPAYNAEKYIAEAINSILNQTFTDFELIIIDDCSIDNTVDIIKKFKDSRIHFYQNENNLGIAKNLNRALDLAVGNYIARMDSDDISLPERLEKQVKYLEGHPNIAVVGTGIECFGVCWDKRIFSVSSEQLKVDLLFSSCFAHPTVMMRADIIGKNALHYDPYFSKMEDYDLWCRVAEKHEIASLPEVLLKYRVHTGQVTQSFSEENVIQMYELKKRQLEQLHIQNAGNKAKIFTYFCMEKYKKQFESVLKIYSILNEIEENNAIYKIYNREILKQTISVVKSKLLNQLSIKQSLQITILCKDYPIKYVTSQLLSKVLIRFKSNYKKFRLKKRLKNRKFTIVSNNCWGSFIYQKYGLKYRTPTVGLYILGHDFIKLSENWKYYFSQNLEFIAWEKASYYSELKEVKPYPVAKLGDIEIYFMHYHSEEEAREKWNRRVKRINPDHMLFKLSQREECSENDIRRFMQLPLEHKICFAYDKVPGTIYIPELKEWIGDEMPLVEHYYDELELLNEL